jgi:uncharacterized protein YhbP (UPF0306 family)
MVTNDAVMWEKETSLWFQKLIRTGPQEYVLQREYVIDPLERMHRIMPMTPVRPTSVNGATLVRSLREVEWPNVDVFYLKNGEQLALIMLDDSRNHHEIRNTYSDIGRLIATHHRNVGEARGSVYHLDRLTKLVSRSSIDISRTQSRMKLSNSHLHSLQVWAEEFQNAQSGVASQGNLTMGSIFIGENATEVTYGPEDCYTYPEFDVGWLLGELTELEYSFKVRQLDGCHIPLCASSFLDAYQETANVTLDLPRLARVVALRICLHYFDFFETFPTIEVSAADLSFLEWLIHRARDLEGSHVKH